MKGLAVCLALILFSPSLFAIDDMSKYKQCNTQFQNLLARQSDITRLHESILIHKQAYKKFNQGLNKNLADFHEQHVEYLSHVLDQQQDSYKKLKSDYLKNCASNPQYDIGHQVSIKPL